MPRALSRALGLLVLALGLVRAPDCAGGQTGSLDEAASPGDRDGGVLEFGVHDAELFECPVTRQRLTDDVALGFEPEDIEMFTQGEQSVSLGDAGTVQLSIRRLSEAKRVDGPCVLAMELLVELTISGEQQLAWLVAEGPSEARLVVEVEDHNWLITLRADGSSDGYAVDR